MRTELGRVYATAGQERMAQARTALPGLRKQWRRSGKTHERPGHVAMDGQVRDVDEPYTTPDGGGLLYPRDPRGPAAETINCGCQSLPWMESWEQAGALRHAGARPREEGPAVVTEDDPTGAAGAGATDPAPGWRRWRRASGGAGGQQREAMEVGRLSAPVTKFLEHKGYEDPAAHGVTITRERLHHIDSGHPTPGRGRRRPKPPVTPADMDRLPAGIARPRAVLWDTQGPEGGNLIYAYDSVEPLQDVVKVPVQPNQKEKRPASSSGPRPAVITHSVRTAGYVQRHNLLREGRYQLIEGSLEDDAADDEPVVVGRLRPGRWGGGEGE